MLEFCQWLDQTAVGSTIRQSLWLFPAIETVHLLGMAALVGTITLLDLRLLGWAMPQRRISERRREFAQVAFFCEARALSSCCWTVAPILNL